MRAMFSFSLYWMLCTPSTSYINIKFHSRPKKTNCLFRHSARGSPPQHLDSRGLDAPRRRPVVRSSSTEMSVIIRFPAFDFFIFPIAHQLSTTLLLYRFYTYNLHPRVLQLIPCESCQLINNSCYYSRWIYLSRHPW